MTFSQRIQSVSELNASISGLLETQFPFVSVVGEISNLRKPYSGHFYFTLKDDRSQLRSVLFKSQQRFLSTLPQEGQHVICHGRISVYEPRGEYQIVVDYLEAVGTGALLQNFENLKKKLADLGLFDQSGKKSLPLLPRLVTLITSPTGAAVHDFLKMATQRCPAVPLEIFPVRVQGSEAPAEICRALDEINRLKKSDVIVLCRGGGSIEDLQPFNDEALAMAVHKSFIPVVSAVGHDVDYTIADFVADARAATPSAAAELILPDHRSLERQISSDVRKLTNSMRNRILTEKQQVSILSSYLGDPGRALEFFMLKTDNAAASLTNGLNRTITARREELHKIMSTLHDLNPAGRVETNRQRCRHLSAILIERVRHMIERRRDSLHRNISLLEAVSPRAVLERGYAIVESPATSLQDSSVLRSADNVLVGDTLRVLLSRGRLLCRVIETEKE